jgi:hypothetical protein
MKQQKERRRKKSRTTSQQQQEAGMGKKTNNYLIIIRYYVLCCAEQCVCVCFGVPVSRYPFGVRRSYARVLPRWLCATKKSRVLFAYSVCLVGCRTFYAY